VLERMNDDLDWMQTLGEAFIQNEERLLAAIQSLRHKAEMEGHLDEMENLEISHDDNSIVIEPRRREVIYVPYYDTRVVYGHWDWAHYPPVYWDWGWHRGHHHVGHHYNYSHNALFSWHHGVHVSSHIFFSAFHWSNHHVVVLNRRHHGYRHYNHRRHIVRDRYAERWHHNPVHRRGLAYRSYETRKRAQRYAYHSPRTQVGGSRVRHEPRRDYPGVRKTINRQERIDKQARLTRRLESGRSNRKNGPAARERSEKHALASSGHRRQTPSRSIDSRKQRVEPVAREKRQHRSASVSNTTSRQIHTRSAKRELKPQRPDKSLARHSSNRKTQSPTHSRREQSRPVNKTPRAAKPVKQSRRSEVKFSATTRHRDRK